MQTHESRQHLPPHTPQLTEPPQPFGAAPQTCPCGPQASALVRGVQPQTLGVAPPLQVSGAMHCDVPQSTCRLQLLTTRPHLPMQVTVINALVQPQTLRVVPPPQVAGSTHWVTPQSTVLPQRSTT